MSDHLPLSEERLVQDGVAELWAAFDPVSRRLHGHGAALHVELRNMGAHPVQVLALEFAWQDGHPHRLELSRVGVIAPGAAWTVLHPRSYAEVLELAKAAGKSGFGVDRTVHDVAVYTTDGIAKV